MFKLKKNNSHYHIILDSVLEVLKEKHPHEVSSDDLVKEVENRINRFSDDPLFKDMKFMGYTGTFSEVYGAIDHLIKCGEIDDSQRGFGGGLKISGDGIKKLDLGGHEKEHLRNQAN